MNRCVCAWGRRVTRSTRVRLWLVLAYLNAFVLVLPWFAPLRTLVLPAFLGGNFPFLSVCFAATFLFHVVTLPSEVWRVLVPIALLTEVPSLLGASWPSWHPPFGCGLALVATVLRWTLALRAKIWAMRRRFSPTPPAPSVRLPPDPRDQSNAPVRA